MFLCSPPTPIFNVYSLSTALFNVYKCVGAIGQVLLGIPTLHMLRPALADVDSDAENDDCDEDETPPKGVRSWVFFSKELVSLFSSRFKIYLSN